MEVWNIRGRASDDNQVVVMLLILIRTRSACNMFHVIMSEQGSNQKT